MSGKSPELIVKAHHPRKTKIITGVLIVFVIASGAALFLYGRSRAGYDFLGLQRTINQLGGQVAILEKENKKLRERTAILKRAREVDTEAYTDVNSSLKGLQEEVLELKEEVAFYRSIVTPHESSRGLRIQTLEFRENGQERGYRYRLILTQVMKNNRITRGTVSITIEGLADQDIKELSLRDIVHKEKELKFKFKYFQHFEGNIVLPENFIPQRVRLDIVSNRINMNKTFDWAFISNSNTENNPG